MADAPRVASARSFLIAAGTSEYRYLAGADLPSVAGDVESISGCFQRLGYERVLADCSLNQAANTFKSAVGEWFASDHLTPIDRVIFYYSGHGEMEGRHYLLFADSRPKRLVDTAIAVEDLVRIMFTHSRIQQALVIIDTCYSGHAILDASAIAGALSRDWNVDADHGVYFIAACRPKEFAYEGRFAFRLAEVVLNDDERAGGMTVEYLQPGSIVEILRERFGKPSNQHVNWGAVGASGLSRLLTNLRYDQRARPGVDLESMRTLARGSTADELPHNVRFFTGREAALDAITAWLRNPADARACVVTGRPGTGKSTILARLASEFPGFVRVVSPRARTLENVAEDIARGIDLEKAVRVQLERATGAESTRILTSAVALRRQPICVAIDGLDEAAQPAQVGREILAGLAALPHVRVLVASRAETRPGKTGRRVPSVGPALEIDLDRAEYADPAAVAHYAKRVLNDAATYRGRAALLDETAAAVARKAGNVFLIARILCRTLTDAAEAMSPDALDLLGDHVGPAFDAYLDRFDAAPQDGLNKRRVVDLMEPLAWAEGEGLPWEHLWAPLARVISGHEYSDSDIRALLQRAGAFIVEDQSHGHSVYRLYHAALAEHLRDASRAADIHGRIALTLRALTPVWTQAHPYVRSKIAIHAARGGVLGQFADDPLFLASVEPGALAHASSLTTAALTPMQVQVLNSAVFDLQSARSPDEALSYLELHARQAGAREMAGRIADLPVVRRWSVPWAHWNPPPAHRLLARLSDFVKVAASQPDGAPLVVTSSGHGVQVMNLRTNQVRELRPRTPVLRDKGGPIAAAGSPERPLLAESRHERIELWDLRSFALVAELTAPEAVRPVHVRVGERTHVVAGSASGLVYLWDLEHGTAPIRTFDGHTEEVMAVLTTRVAGREVVVSGGKDGAVIFHDLATGARLARADNAKRWVFSLAAATRGGRDVILAGYFGGEIIAWDPLTGERAGAPVESTLKADYAVYGMALAEIDGTRALVSAESDGAVRVRDLETGRLLRQPVKGHEPHTSAWSLALVRDDGRTIAISGGADGTARAWDLTAEAAARPDSGSPIYKSLAAVTRAGRPAVLAVREDDLGSTVDELEAETGVLLKRPRRRIDAWRYQSAVAEFDRRTIVAFGSYNGDITAFDAGTGKPAGGAWRRCHGHTVVAFSEYRRRLALAVGDEAPALHLFDFSSGTSFWTIPAPHGKRAISAVGAGRLEGRAVVLSSGYDDRLRAWDAESLAQVVDIDKGSLHVQAITLGALAGRPLVVFGTHDGSLHVTDPDGRTRALVHVGSEVEAVAIASPSTIAVATARGLLSIRWHES